MGLRNRIRRLERGDEDERYTLMCPECGERFVVHGRGLHEPAADFLLSVWKKGYQGAPYQDPPEEIRRVAEHAHDASEFIDTATGDPWLGEFFRGVEHEWPSDVPDLSEQACGFYLP